MILKPYLTFNGNAEEALNFYAAAFNGQILGINRYEGAPLNAPEDYKNKIMHAELQFGNHSILFCDTLPDSSFIQGNSFSMSLDCSSVEEIERIFHLIAENGEITMPLQDTFWGARFGMCIDRFGIRWMFNHDSVEATEEA